MRKAGKTGIFTMAIGLVFLLAAACVAGYSFWGEYRAAEYAQNALTQVEQLMAEESVSVNEADVLSEISGKTADRVLGDTGREKPTDYEMTVRMVDGLRYVGIIEIPSLSLKLPVIDEWDDEKLKIAPCRYIGSVYDGTMIISGHSYKNHFRFIRKLTAGDSVIFTDLAGTRFFYEVISSEIIGGDDVEAMLSGTWDMSLFTCTYNGSARHTVRCKRILDDNFEF